jgi:isohexenylglutaconyl-CoA hydratase
MGRGDEEVVGMPYETLIVARDGPVLKIAMSRPEARNALSQTMVRELTTVFEQARDDDGTRAVVLSGAGGTFCAGGDLKGMEGRREAAHGDSREETATSNRRFGALLELIDQLPKAVIVLVEGAAMGGAVGLIAVSDWAIAEKSAQIGTPEVTVGLVPAQIAPFIVARVGYTHARRLAAYGLRLGAEEALRVGLVHEVAEGRDGVAARGVAALNQVLRCAPEAVAETKKLARASLREPLGPTLDAASHMFAAALAGEAREGIRAFVEKRKPAWVAKVERL